MIASPRTALDPCLLDQGAIRIWVEFLINSFRHLVISVFAFSVSKHLIANSLPLVRTRRKSSFVANAVNICSWLNVRLFVKLSERQVHLSQRYRR